ncbi:MAG: alpha/beta fold hydrolase [Gemmataceae bacterium]
MEFFLVVVLALGQPPALDICDPVNWPARRTEILAGMKAAMGEFPAKGDPLDVRISQKHEHESYTRYKLTYGTENGDRVPAWLLIPKGKPPGGKWPAVLCLHQTVAIGKDEPVGLGKREELQYAKHLTERGYVTLAPDYPSFGEYRYDFTKSKWASGSLKAVYNNRRAVDLLVERPEVDAKNIGVIGHSLGGHTALFTAVFDERLRACVSNCGFTSFPKYYGGKIAGWTSDRYMPRLKTVYKLDPARVPFDFPQVLAAIAPRAVLASSPMHDDNFAVEGVRDCIRQAKPIFRLLGAEANLQANYPDCGHSFPSEARKVAYAFLDQHLKKR